MAWRYKTSKFKNTNPTLPKKEATIFDVPVSSSCTNNGIDCSTDYVAFEIDAEGGKIGVVPIEARGRHTRNELSVICAHSTEVADFRFMPYDKNVLVTCCRDEDEIKVWRIDSLCDSTTTTPDSYQPFCDSNPSIRIRLCNNAGGSCLAPHTTATDVLAVGYNSNAVGVLDLINAKTVYEMHDLESRPLSMAWDSDGRRLAVLDVNQNVYVYDVRASQQAIQKITSHSGHGREGRILYLDGCDKFLTSGFTEKKCQEILIFDGKDLNAGPVHRQEFDTSTGLLIPLYDPDTKLVFLCGKGSKSFRLMEIVEDTRNGLLGPVCMDGYSSEQTVGACLSPKTRMDVMSGEVQRLWLIGKHSVLPIPCIVPRRTYRNFLPELFPNTVGQIPGCSAKAWFGGDNRKPPRFSLNPSDKDQLNKRPVLAVEMNRQTKPTTMVVTNGIVDNDILHSKDESTKLNIPNNKTSNNNGLQANNDILHKTPSPAPRLRNEGSGGDAENNTPLSAYKTPMTSMKSRDQRQSDDRPITSTPLATKTNQGAAADGGNSNRPITTRATDESRRAFFADNTAVSAINQSTNSKPDFVSRTEVGMHEHDSTADLGHHAPHQQRTPEASGDSADLTETSHTSVRNSILLFESPVNQQQQQHVNDRKHHNNHHRLSNSPPVIPQSHEISHLSELDDSIGPLPFDRKKPDDEPVVKHRRGRQSMDPRERPVSKVLGANQAMTTSKFRHCEAVPGGRDDIFTALRQVHTGLPPECNGLAVSREYAAVALTGPGGLVQIHTLSKPCKILPGVLHGVENAAGVTDMQWSPHDPNVLAVGCANGLINVWTIPDGGIKDQSILETKTVLHVPSGKVTMVRWHPHASNILLVAATGGQCMVYDVTKPETPAISLKPLEKNLQSMCWSSGGRRLATFASDGQLRVYDPRKSIEPVKSVGLLHAKTRASRVLFACDDRVIVLSHFAGNCERAITLFESDTLLQLHHLVVDRSSSQLLIPHVDDDTCVLWLTAKGDSTVHMYELRASEPHLLPIMPFKASTSHNSMAVQQKIVCDVKNVEFARAWRLSKDTLEPVHFKVPRVNKDLFANDIFPPALVTWRPAVSGADWLKGADVKLQYESLCPEGMANAYDPNASSTASQPPVANKNSTITRQSKSKPSPTENGLMNGHHPDQENNNNIGITNKQPADKAKEITNQLSDHIDKLAMHKDACGLEQDKMEGVDPDEWHD